MLFAIGISKKSKKRFLLTIEKFGKLYKVLWIKELPAHNADQVLDVEIESHRISLSFTKVVLYTLTIDELSAIIKSVIFVKNPEKGSPIALNLDEIADFTPAEVHS